MKKSVSTESMQRVDKALMKKILQLPKETSFDGIKEYEHTDDYFVSFPESFPRLCPHCGGSDCVKKDSRRQTVRHIPIGNKGTFISFTRRRYLCKSCCSSFLEPVYWVYEGARITTALYLAICVELQSTKSLNEIALNLRITEPVVRGVLEAIPFGPMPYLPETLCIDEFAGHTGIWNADKGRWDTQKFHCIIADGDADSRAVLEILPEPTMNYLIKYFKSNFTEYQRQKVKYFCCDFRPGFRTVGRECFRSAKICLDKFHVVKQQTDRIKQLYNAVKKRLLASEPDEVKRSAINRLFYRAHYLLLSRKSEFSGYWFNDPEKKQERLDRILALDEELAEAWHALQEFYDILHFDSFALQRYHLGEWISTYSLSHYEGMRRIANLYRTNKQYILNAFEYNKSNSTCEGFNANIKLLKKNGYGAHKFRNFRKRILFAFGNLRFVKETYTIFAERQNAARKEATS